MYLSYIYIVTIILYEIIIHLYYNIIMYDNNIQYDVNDTPHVFCSQVYYIMYTS